jgi:hypothetical protein
MINENVGYRIDINNENLYTITGDRQSTGHSLIPRINAGIGLNITRKISLRLDMTYISGRIGAFEIMSSTLNPTEVGETLSYSSQDEEEKPYIWELQGINLGIALGIKF